MSGKFRPNAAFHWAISFVIGTPILISAILVWIGLDRIADFKSHHHDVASATIRLVAEDIRNVIDDHRRLVTIYAEINREKIATLAKHPHNDELRDALHADLERWFPNMFTFTISDHDGTPFLDDFDGNIGMICREDMHALATENNYKIRIHPNQHAYHFDIMSKWGDDSLGGIFFISFRPEVIVTRLGAASPPGHELLLLIQQREYLIEITEIGSRDKTPREDYRMPAQQKAQILDMVPVTHTEWHLADLHEPELFSGYENRIYLTYGAIVCAFLFGSITITLLLVYFERQRLMAKQMRDEMMSLFSHDLRSPLVAILGALGLLKSNSEINSPQTKKLIQLTHANAEIMNRIVNDILDINKLESGKMDFDFKAIDINELCQKACDNNQTYAHKFSVSLVHADSPTPVIAMADEQRLLQALTNLISNAIKYSFENGTVTIRCDKKQSIVKISVVDHGVGIPTEYQDRLFEKFTQAKQPVRKKVPSTGLGLAIVKSIVEAHQGRVYFDKTEDQGTTFYIELPLSNAKNG